MAEAPNSSFKLSVAFSLNDHFISKRVPLSVDIDGNLRSPAEQRARIKRPLELIKVEKHVFERRSSCNHHGPHQPLSPLGYMLSEYSPLARVRVMPGCVAAACQRLVTAPGKIQMTSNRTWYLAECVMDRVTRGRVKKVQVRLQRCACCALRCDCACIVCQ